MTYLKLLWSCGGGEVKDAAKVGVCIRFFHERLDHYRLGSSLLSNQHHSLKTKICGIYL